jgi:hypothetical protein
MKEVRGLAADSLPIAIGTGNAQKKSLKKIPEASFI